MTIEEQLKYAKLDGLINEDGTSNVISAEKLAADAYLTAEYNQILINTLMEGNA